MGFARLACTAAAPVACLTPREIVKQLPPQLEVPKLGVKLVRAIDEVEADRDVHKFTLGMIRQAASAHCEEYIQLRRRGRAKGSWKPASRTSPHKDTLTMEIWSTSPQQTSLGPMMTSSDTTSKALMLWSLL